MQQPKSCVWDEKTGGRPRCAAVTRAQFCSASAKWQPRPPDPHMPPEPRPPPEELCRGLCYWRPGANATVRGRAAAGAAAPPALGLVGVGGACLPLRCESITNASLCTAQNESYPASCEWLPQSAARRAEGAAVTGAAAAGAGGKCVTWAGNCSLLRHEASCRDRAVRTNDGSCSWNASRRVCRPSAPSSAPSHSFEFNCSVAAWYGAGGARLALGTPEHHHHTLVRRRPSRSQSPAVVGSLPKARNTSRPRCFSDDSASASRSLALRSCVGPKLLSCFAFLC